jgi:LmbE family N-acetylglucosaminyl deacetylase
MANPLKLLAVFPHPDDESLGLGGTLAKYSAEGVETYLVCATRGERGWNGPEDQDPGMAALGKIREGELKCAAEHLGLKEVTFLNYIDGDVDQANPRQIIADIATHVRRIRPQVVVTFSLDGSYGHPDHIALAQFTSAALVCAASGSYKDSQNQAPYQVSKHYYMVDTKATVEELTQGIGGISMEIDGVERSHIGWDDWAISARIDVSQYFDTVWKAILCHQSQLPGYGPLINLPREALTKFIGEGTFLRAFSMVNGGRVVESDLFEGLR